MDCIQTLLDSTIDEDLKRLFNNVVKISNKKTTKDKIELLNSEELIKVIDIIRINAEFSFNKTRNLLHIILYVYIYTRVFEDEVLKKYNFEELIEENSTDEILYELSTNDYLEYYVFQCYFRIIFDKDIEEIITSNLNYCDNLETWKIWDLSFNNEVDIITNKIKNIILSLKTYCILIEANDEAFIELLYFKNDVFGVIDESFQPNYFFSYLPILMAMLHIDTYFYLTCKENLRIEEKKLLTKVKKALEDKNIYTLPKDKNYTLMLYECFTNLNYDKDDVLDKHPLQKEETKKLIRTLNNHLLLIEY